MNLDTRLNLIPDCLRGDRAITEVRLDQCLQGSITYYINLLIIVIGIAAFIYLVYAGIKMATSFGNEAKYTEAKSTITFAVLGIIIAVLAYTIVSFVTGFFGAPAPQVVNQETGQQVTNDPTKVTPLVAAQSLSGQPDDLTLTDQEFAAAQNGSAGDSVNLRGQKVEILLLNRDYFTASLEWTTNGKVTKTQSLQTRSRGEYYWVRSWGNRGDYQGATLILRQDGHSRRVTINAP